MKNKLIIALAIGATLALLGTGVAMAQGGDTIPHGGYDTTTNSCLFCHDIHEAAGDYVLMRQTTVVETCGTCHDVYLDSEGWTANLWDNPNDYPGDTPDLATVSDLAVYEVDYADKDNAGGHKLSQGDGDFTFADGAVDDANYIPGGSDRLNVLADIAVNGYNPTIPDITDSTDNEATAGLYCASCHTPHGEFGQLLKDSAGAATIGSDGRGKLLSSRPNHSDTETTVDDWGDEGGPNWCAKCHDLRLDEANGGTEHNHPSEYCLNCHGTYAGPVDEDYPGEGYPSEDSVTDDFPHTSPEEAQNILTDLPDALCLQCHAETDPPELP